MSEWKRIKNSPEESEQNAATAQTYRDKFIWRTGDG